MYLLYLLHHPAVVKESVCNMVICIGKYKLIFLWLLSLVSRSIIYSTSYTHQITDAVWLTWLVEDKGIFAVSVMTVVTTRRHVENEDVH